MGEGAAEREPRPAAALMGSAGIDLCKEIGRSTSHAAGNLVLTSTAEADKQLFEAALTAAARSVALPRLMRAMYARPLSGVKRT